MAMATTSKTDKSALASTGQWEFVFTYEVTEELLTSLRAKVKRVARRGKFECVSELRQGGGTSVKRYAEHVCHLNGKSEALPFGLRFNGRA